MSKINKLFTYLIVLFPLLSIYYFGIATLTFADIFLIILLPFLFIKLYKSDNKPKISILFFIIIFYIIIQMLIYYDVNIINSQDVFTTLRLLLYYIVIGLFLRDFFDLKLGMKIYKNVCVLSSLFYIFQFIMLKVFNIFISGTLPFFKTTVDNYNIIMMNHAWTSSAYARPRSFFTEPSHFAIYVALCLALLLYQKDKKNLKYIFIITISMLLSGSGMAIILALIIYLLSLISNITNFSKKNILILIITIIILIPIGYKYTQSESFNIFYNRTFIQGDSTEGRFGNFIESFKKSKNLLSVVFGEGIYKIADVEGQDYITSIPRIYTYFGILGFVFFSLITIYYLKKLNGINKISLIILIAISFAGEILFHNMIFIYMPYILCKERND